MSQEIFANINPNTTSGTQLAQMLVPFKDAMVSGMSGPARPSQIKEGGIWVSTANLVSNDIYTVYFFDGVKDIKLFDIDKTLGIATVNNVLELLEVSENSVSSDGPELILKKSRNGGQTKLGDTLGEMIFKGVSNDAIAMEQAKITVEALEDVTSSAQGAVMKFMVTPPVGVGAVEVIRVYNGMVGVGLSSAPTEKLHVNDGNILVSKESDTETPKLITKIKSETGINGGVASGKTLFNIEARSTDNAGDTFVASEIVAISEEAHTASVRGTNLIFRTIKKGATSLSEAFKYVNNKFITNIVEAVDALFTNLVATNITTEDITVSDTITANTAIITNLVATNTTLGTVTEIEDASIILNKDGDEATAIATKAGIEVEMSDADNAIFGYSDTSATKFVIGTESNLKPVVDTETSQTLKNKAIESVSKLEPKRDTLANLTSYSTTASAGQLVSDTDNNDVFVTTGSGLKKLEVAGIKPSVTVSASNIDWLAGFVFYKAITGNITFTHSNVTDGKTISIIINNTSASSVTITLPSGVLKDADFPTTIGAGKTIVVTLMSGGSKTVAVATGEME